ncbi:MAG TPA: ATP-grasp domain-containing protein [Syntrophales bacterium]|nr:ATP-grasp domain-containing protein [Syntrophales bacterium]
MNVVMMSPHFPPNYDLFSVHLNNLGATVLGIGDANREGLAPRLKDALTDYYRVDDMHLEGQIHDAMRYFTDRYGPIDRFESHNDHWLDMDARMRIDYNIPGPKPEDILWMRHKSLMKKGFAEAGVRTPKWRIATSLKDALAWVAETGYPLAIKPDSGVGASNTFRIESEKDLEDFFAKKPEGDFIMEEFITGTIFTFDGLTDRDGRILFCSSLRYSAGMMEYVNDQLDVVFHTLREMPADLEEAGRKSVGVFHIRERFFHIEFFRTHDKNDLVALEINARPPGGPIVDIYNYASDMDLYRKWAQAVTDNTEGLGEMDKPYHCAYMGRRHTRSYLHSHEEIMSTFGHMVVHHEPVQKVFSTAMGDYYYIVRSHDLEDIEKAANFVVAPGH